jgi:N-acetylmuramoyl-L-alanine amidase
MNYTIEKRIFSIYQNPLTAANLIIAHESGNLNNVGRNSLENEVSYMLRNWQNAFVSHWVGGGGKIIQIANTGKVQWGVGPKANGYAYAQVELARTNNRSIFEQDYKAYVWLLQKLALEAGIPCTLNSGASVQDRGIKTHSWVSKNVGGTNHTDPDGYLASWGISQARFRQDIEAGLSALPPLRARQHVLAAPRRERRNALGLVAKIWNDPGYAEAAEPTVGRSDLDRPATEGAPILKDTGNRNKCRES